MEEETANIVHDDSVIFHAPQRPFRYSQSKRYLLIYSVLCICFGLIVIGAGVSQIVILPFFVSRQSFQVETKWMSLSILFAGFSGLGYLWNPHSVTFLTMTLVTSIISIPLAIAQLIIHAVNVYFRHKDLLHYRVERQEKLESIASSVSTLNVVLMITGLSSAVVVSLLHRYTIQIIMKNYGYKIRMDKHRLRLALIGLAQMVLGLMVSGWWAGVEAFFHGQNIDSHTLPTGEILGHGLIIACAGYLQMVATSEGSLPVLYGTTGASACALLLAVYYTSYPVSVLYFVMEKTSGEGNGYFDEKVILCIILAFIYIAIAALALYSFLKLSQVSCCEAVKQYGHFAPFPGRAYATTTVVQLILGVIYCMVEVLTVGLFYAYKIDFSSLPVVSITLGVLLFLASRTMHPLHYSAAAAAAVLATAFSTRDVYLFAYHTLSNKTADRTNERSIEGISLALHAIQAVTAVVQFVIGILILVLIAKVMKRSFSLVGVLGPRTQAQRGVDRLLLWISLLAITFGVVMIVGGLRMFVETSSLYVADFGDRSVFFGFCFILCGVLGALSVKNTVLAIPSLFSFLAVFLVVWQESDRMTFLTHLYSQDFEYSKSLDMAPFRSELSFHETVDFGLSCCVLLFMLVYCFMCILYVFGLGSKLAKVRLMPVDPLALASTTNEELFQETSEQMIDVSKLRSETNGNATDHTELLG